MQMEIEIVCVYFLFISNSAVYIRYVAPLYVTIKGNFVSCFALKLTTLIIEEFHHYNLFWFYYNIILRLTLFM